VPLREADALAHWCGCSKTGGAARSGSLDALRDIESVEIELMLNDLEQASNESAAWKDLKKRKNGARNRAAAPDPLPQALESETPLRELDFKPEELKMLSSFEFSPESHAYVLNLGDDEAADIDRVIENTISRS